MLKTTTLATTATLLLAIGCGPEPINTDDPLQPAPVSKSGVCTPREPAGSSTDGTVRFRFTSKTSAAPYVITVGMFCSPFTISNAHTVAPYAPQCEGAPPPPPHAVNAVRADGSDFVWDGRVVQTYQGCADCTVWGRGIEPATMWTSVHLPPGRYVATFGVLSEPPSEPSYYNNWGFYSPIAERCRAGRTFSVTFDLPASGEALVDVDVPPAAEYTAPATRDLPGRARAADLGDAERR